MLFVVFFSPEERETRFSFVSSVVAFASRGYEKTETGGNRAYLGVGRGGGVEHALVDIAGLELRAFRGEASDGGWIGASGFFPGRARKKKKRDRGDFSRDRARGFGPVSYTHLTLPTILLV